MRWTIHSPETIGSNLIRAWLWNVFAHKRLKSNYKNLLQQFNTILFLKLPRESILRNLEPNC